MKLAKKNVLSFIFILMLVLLVGYSARPAEATDKPKYGVDNSVRTNTHNTNSSAESAAESVAESTAESVSEAASESTSSNGDQISMNSSQFYALSLQFPSAAGCFSGAQAGGNDNNDSAFLGIHILNKSCWLDKLASHEPDIEINARLKCGDKHYRNAVAYDVPGKDRRAKCIQMKMDSGQAQMAEFQRMLGESEERQAMALGEVKSELIERDDRIHQAGAEK